MSSFILFAQLAQCVCEQRAYLLTSLHVLITQLNDKASGVCAPAPLLFTHLRLLARHPTVTSLLPYAKNLTKLAKRYTSLNSGRTDSHVWLARFEAEMAFATAEDRATELQKTCQEARSVVHGDGVIDVWLWQLSPSLENLDEEGARQEIRTLEVRFCMLWFRGATLNYDAFLSHRAF